MTTVRRDLIGLAFVAALLFVPWLGARDLWNPNEPLYGQAVSEMAARGDWLVPTVNGSVFDEKPILYFWLALAASSVLGGVSETAPVARPMGRPVCPAEGPMACASTSSATPAYGSWECRERPEARPLASLPDSPRAAP